MSTPVPRPSVRVRAVQRPPRQMRALLATIALMFMSAAAANPLAIGVIVPDADGASEVTAAVARGAEQGAEMAEEEHLFNADIFGLEFAVPIVRADGADQVTAAAQTLLDEQEIVAVAGGFTLDEAAALSAWSAETGVPFLNVGAEHDALRNDLCEATSFHVAPSAGMYLDALVGWYVRSAFRDWFFVLGEGMDAEALADRTRWSMRERHFGAREAGRASFERGGDAGALADAIDRSGADVVLLLMDAEHQLETMAALEETGSTTIVAGFPTGETQTRTFFDLSRTVAPTLGTDHRATAWEASLDAYGAREINARFRDMFGVPMEPSAWATYQAVKVVFEAATLGGSSDPEAVVEYITGPEGVFDVWKGIGVTFRPWDHQLRQSLFLVRIREDAQEPFDYADLVGQLPAIYMPGTDPEERLDQLGDLRARSTCAF